jgi:hypothetical protein
MLAAPAKIDWSILMTHLNAGRKIFKAQIAVCASLVEAEDLRFEAAK